MANAAAGHFSRTVFMASASIDPVPETCAIGAALDAGLGPVPLRFRPGAARTPRTATVALVHEGARLVMRHCVPWPDGGVSRAAIVPWDAREHFHFASGPHGRRPPSGSAGVIYGALSPTEIDDRATVFAA
jgi:hypothetical protein